MPMFKVMFRKLRGPDKTVHYKTMRKQKNKGLNLVILKCIAILSIQGLT